MRYIFMKMSDIALNLLKTYYGFGQENTTTKSFTTHEAVISYRNKLSAESISTDSIIIDSIDDNAVDKQCSTEANVPDSTDENDSEEKLIRSSRAIVNDEDTNDDNFHVNDSRELILDSIDIDKDTGDETKTAGINLVSASSKAKITHEASATSPVSLGILEAIVQDNVSDVSSSLTSKKNLRKKSRAVAPVPAQLPPLRCNSAARRTPTCDGTFYNMSNSFVAEFPINLLDEIQNIKMLYLENNCLENLPDELFIKLRYLEWLDVRHNRLTSLPSTIKNHSALETILLQGNQIERLPLELGVVPNLKGLQLQDNPLVFPPPNILALGFTAIIKFLRKQWNMEHPDEMVHPVREVKSGLTVLCHKPPTIQSSSEYAKMIANSSSTVLPKLQKSNPSIREKSWNYKPSNRYGKVNPAEYNSSNLNNRENKFKNLKNDILCNNCYNKCRKTHFPCNIDDNSNIYHNIKIKMREKENIAKKYSESTQMSMLTKKDAGTVVKLDINNCEKLNKKNIKLPKIQKPTLAEEIKQMEDIKVKERVYSVITNDGIMTKLRPMRLKDPDWALAFIENYLNIANRPLEYSALCNSSGTNATLERKLQWISRVKEELSKQAAALQKIKDQEVLKNWRQDRRTFDKSIDKARSRTSEDIPYGVDYSDLPFLNNEKQLPKEKRRMNSPSKNVDTGMTEISMLLKQLKTDKQSGKLDVATELKRLQEQIEKLSDLQRQIHRLKKQNQTTISKYDDVDLCDMKKLYKAPPSIII